MEAICVSANFPSWPSTQVVVRLSYDRGMITPKSYFFTCHDSYCDRCDVLYSVHASRQQRHWNFKPNLDH